MTARPLRRRRFADFKVIGVIAIVAFTAFSVAYRVWAYHGWMEYKLTCINGDVDIFEIPLPTTPELRTAIDEHF